MWGEIFSAVLPAVAGAASRAIGGGSTMGVQGSVATSGASNSMLARAADKRAVAGATFGKYAAKAPTTPSGGTGRYKGAGPAGGRGIKATTRSDLMPVTGRVISAFADAVAQSEKVTRKSDAT
jgi:hypothetical protein